MKAADTVCGWTVEAKGMWRNEDVASVQSGKHLHLTCGGRTEPRMPG